MSLVVYDRLVCLYNCALKNRAVSDQLNAPAILSRQAKPLFWTPRAVEAEHDGEMVYDTHLTTHP